MRLAFAGDFDIELTRGRAKRTLQSWRTLTLNAGDTLQLGNTRHGKVGYVAISGGFDLPRIMGSRATYMRGGFGGVNGDRLQPNTGLPVSQTHFEGKEERQLPGVPELESLGLIAVDEESPAATVRVILGPQEDYFTDAAREDFLNGIYSVSRESDRMGSRLVGPKLIHNPEKNLKSFPTASFRAQFRCRGMVPPLSCSWMAQQPVVIPKLPQSSPQTCLNLRACRQGTRPLPGGHARRSRRTPAHQASEAEHCLKVSSHGRQSMALISRRCTNPVSSVVSSMLWTKQNPLFSVKELNRQCKST